MNNAAAAADEDAVAYRRRVYHHCYSHLLDKVRNAVKALVSIENDYSEDWDHRDAEDNHHRVAGAAAVDKSVDHHVEKFDDNTHHAWDNDAHLQ